MDHQTFLTAVDYTGTSGGGDSVSPALGAAPTLLTATADADSIVLDWTNNDTYSLLVLERKTTDQYTVLTTPAGDAETYNDTTAVQGITYTYKIRGLKNGYPTPYSNEDSDVVPIAPIAATGTITVVDYTQVIGDTVTIAGQAFTEGALDEFGWEASTSNTVTADSIASAVAGRVGLNSPITITDNVVNLVAGTPGEAGNAITLVTSDAVNLVISGPHLTGGQG